MARQPDDESLAFEPAQVVGGLAAGVGLSSRVATARTRVGLSKPASRWVNPTMAAITAITRGSPNGSAGACWPSICDGRVTSVKVATSGAGGHRLLARRTDAGWPSSPTARRAFEFSAVTRRPMPKSRVLQMTVSVRNARCSLKYCLIRLDSVVAADLRIDPSVMTLVRQAPGVGRMIRLSKISDTDSGRPRRGGRG